MEGTLDGLGRGQAGGVADGAWGPVLGITPSSRAACPLPAPGRVSWPRRQGHPSLGEEAGLPGPGSAGSALPGGGSQSLCPWLQPAFGPASVDQMCARRSGGVTAVRGLRPCQAVTCQDRAESPWGKLSQMPSPAVFHPAAPAAPRGFGARPRAPRSRWRPSTGLPAGTTGAHDDGDGAGPAWRGTKLKACGDRQTLLALQECSGAWYAQLVH